MTRLCKLASALALLLVTSCAHVPRAAPPHPLDPLSPGELSTAFAVTLAHFRADPSLPKEPLRFPMVVLAEPDKQLVLSWQTGLPFPRHAEVQVLHYPSNRVWVADVDLRRQQVVALALQPLGTQPSLTGEEFEAADRLVRAHEPWQRAMRARGIEPSLTYLDGWAAGDTRLPDEVVASQPYGQDARLLRVLTFLRGTARPTNDPGHPQNPYDRPIEGVVVTVDLNTRRVVHMTNAPLRAVSSETGNAEGARRLRKLVVEQPDGSDIELRGHLVRWRGFQFYVAMHPREGLVLYDVRIEDHGVLRPLAYRLALSEVYVPYGLGDDNWSWRGAFDVGEYNAGKLAQTLEVGRDVPQNAVFLDAVLFAESGPGPKNPTGSLVIPNSIALFERDAGMLWSRTDPSTQARDTRMARELVTTWNCWVGNYIYGFEWIFKLDGSIEVKVQLTGTTLNRGADAEPEASAPKVGRDLRGVMVAAPNHQHFLNFRLDLDVDGPQNHVMEMEVRNLPDPVHPNAFDAVSEHLAAEGPRDVSPFTARHWHVESATRTGPFGKPTGYALEPGAFAIPYASADAPGLQRGQFALHQVWFTRYRADEQYAAGKFPNQAKTRDGVAVYSTPAEPLPGQDVVLWYTTGFTHLAKPEDHPVMSVESIGFRLAPRGFFARNPALELPTTQH
ncbi:MAG: copper amine oxidase [Myxococcaceae bacterium]|nr:copper amine oxidase [Myxococcaceae bacterium]